MTDCDPRRETIGCVDQHRETSEKCQNYVIEKLANMSASKSESEKSTRHGREFKDDVFHFTSNRRCLSSGGAATHVGDKAGLIRNAKTGVAVTLGQKLVAPGAPVVPDSD